MFTNLFQKQKKTPAKFQPMKKARVLYQKNGTPNVVQMYYRTPLELVEQVFAFTLEEQEKVSIFLITDVMNGLRLTWDAVAAHVYFVTEKITASELLDKLKKG